jgi:hypothetical protein
MSTLKPGLGKRDVRKGALAVSPTLTSSQVGRGAGKLSDGCVEPQKQGQAHSYPFLGSKAPVRGVVTPFRKPEHWWEATMPSNLKFPPSVEVKRVIAAAIRAGIEIGSIEIHPRKITIHSRAENAPAISVYDLLKMSEGRDTALVRHTDRQSGAQRKKSGT